MSFIVDNKKIAKNTIALYVRTLITMLISFYTARVTLQVLGVDDYGLNNLVGSVVVLFSFLNSSMGTAVQRFFNLEIGKGNEDRLGKIYGVGLYLHIIVAIVTIIIAEFFAIFFLNKMNIPTERMFAANVVFQISIFSMALTIINVPNYALLKAREMFSKTAMVEIVQSFLRLVVLYLLCTINYDKLITLSVLNFSITLYYTISLLAMARKFPESHHLPLRDRELIQEMLKFISLLLVTVLAELGRKQGLVMLINLFFGLTVNAAYAIAVQVSHMISTFVVNIKQPIIPQMMAAYGAKDMKSMFMLINLGTKITAIMMLLFTLPIIFEIDYLLELWLQTPPQNTSSLVVLVLININVSSFTYFLYQGVHATGNITRQQVGMSVLYGLNILLIWLAFMLGYNFYSALYVTIGISISQCILNLVMANKYLFYNIGYFVRDSFIPYCITAFIISTILYFVTQLIVPSFLRLLIVGIMSIGMCLIVSYYIVLNKNERLKTLLLIQRIKNRC